MSKETAARIREQIKKDNPNSARMIYKHPNGEVTEVAALGPLETAVYAAKKLWWYLKKNITSVPQVQSNTNNTNDTIPMSNVPHQYGINMDQINGYIHY